MRMCTSNEQKCTITQSLSGRSPIPRYTTHFTLTHLLVSLETVLIRACIGVGGGGGAPCIRLSVIPVVSTSVALHTQAQSGSESPTWLDAKFMNDDYSYPPQSDL